MNDVVKLTLGVLAIAAVAAAGDYAWYEFGVAHRMTAGVIHGAVLLYVFSLSVATASNL